MPPTLDRRLRALTRIVFGFALAVFLCACSNGSSDGKPKNIPGARLIGTWEQTGEGVVDLAGAAPPRMSFRADGTFVVSITVKGQTVNTESRWALVEDTPALIRISIEANGTEPAGKGDVHVVDADTIKIGVAQSTQDFIFWRRVK
jgi:hypothetical protein